jgi:hypothetical protein
VRLLRLLQRRREWLRLRLRRRQREWLWLLLVLMRLPLLLVSPGPMLLCSALPRQVDEQRVRKKYQGLLALAYLLNKWGFGGQNSLQRQPCATTLLDTRAPSVLTAASKAICSSQTNVALS